MGRTALHYAYLFMDDPEILNLLERHGSSPDTRDVVSQRVGGRVIEWVSEWMSEWLGE